MNKLKLISFLCTALLLTATISNCNKNRDWEEGDRNTFTWKGQLVKGCKGDPITDELVFLEVGGRLSPDEDWEEVVATDITDANGNFSLTYKKVKGNTYPNIALKTESRSLLSAPINQDIERDVATQNNSRVHVTVNTNVPIDSFYAGISFLIDDSEYIERTYIPESDGKYNVYKTSVKNESFSFILNSDLGGSWDHHPEEMILAYGTSFNEFNLAFGAHHNDSTPDDYNRITYYRHGCPVVDSVEINL